MNGDPPFLLRSNISGNHNEGHKLVEFLNDVLEAVMEAPEPSLLPSKEKGA